MKKLILRFISVVLVACLVGESAPFPAALSAPPSNRAVIKFTDQALFLPLIAVRFKVLPGSVLIGSLLLALGAVSCGQSPAEIKPEHIPASADSFIPEHSSVNKPVPQEFIWTTPLLRYRYSEGLEAFHTVDTPEGPKKVSTFVPSRTWEVPGTHLRLAGVKNFDHSLGIRIHVNVIKAGRLRIQFDKNTESKTPRTEQAVITLEYDVKETGPRVFSVRFTPDPLNFDPELPQAIQNQDIQVIIVGDPDADNPATVRGIKVELDPVPLNISATSILGGIGPEILRSYKIIPIIISGLLYGGMLLGLFNSSPHSALTAMSMVGSSLGSFLAMSLAGAFAAAYYHKPDGDPIELSGTVEEKQFENVDVTPAREARHRVSTFVEHVVIPPGGSNATLDTSKAARETVRRLPILRKIRQDEVVHQHEMEELLGHNPSAMEYLLELLDTQDTFRLPSQPESRLSFFFTFLTRIESIAIEHGGASRSLGALFNGGANPSAVNSAQRQMKVFFDELMMHPEYTPYGSLASDSKQEPSAFPDISLTVLQEPAEAEVLLDSLFPKSPDQEMTPAEALKRDFRNASFHAVHAKHLIVRGIGAVHVNRTDESAEFFEQALAHARIAESTYADISERAKSASRIEIAGYAARLHAQAINLLSEIEANMLLTKIDPLEEYLDDMESATVQAAREKLRKSQETLNREEIGWLELVLESVREKENERRSAGKESVAELLHLINAQLTKLNPEMRRSMDYATLFALVQSPPFLQSLAFEEDALIASIQNAVTDPAMRRIHALAYVIRYNAVIQNHAIQIFSHLEKHIPKSAAPIVDTVLRDKVRLYHDALAALELDVNRSKPYPELEIKRKYREGLGTEKRQKEFHHYKFLLAADAALKSAVYPDYYRDQNDGPGTMANFLGFGAMLKLFRKHTLFMSTLAFLVIPLAIIASEFNFSLPAILIAAAGAFALASYLTPRLQALVDFLKEWEIGLEWRPVAVFSATNGMVMAGLPSLHLKFTRRNDQFGWDTGLGSTRGMAVFPTDSTPPGFAPHPARVSVAGARRVLARGRIARDQTHITRIHMESYQGEDLTYAVLDGFSPGLNLVFESLNLLSRAFHRDISSTDMTWGGRRAARKTILDQLLALPQETLDHRIGLMMRIAVRHLESDLLFEGIPLQDLDQITVEFVMNAGTPLAYNPTTRVLQADFMFYFDRDLYAGGFVIQQTLNRMRLQQLPAEGTPDLKLVDEIVLVLLDARSATAHSREGFAKAGAVAYSDLLNEMAGKSQVEQILRILSAMRMDRDWADGTGLSANPRVAKIMGHVEERLAAFNAHRAGNRYFRITSPEVSSPVVQVPTSISPSFPAFAHSHPVYEFLEAYSPFILVFAFLAAIVVIGIFRGSNLADISKSAMGKADVTVTSGSASPINSSHRQNVTKGKNEYDPNAPGADGDEPGTTSSKLETKLGVYGGDSAQGHRPSSGDSRSGGGSSRRLTTFKEIVELKMSGRELPGLLMMDMANAVEDGEFVQRGPIDFIPSNKLTGESTQMTLRLPPMRKGTAMRFPIVIDGRVDSASMSDPRFWVDAQGWMTSREDIPMGVTVTFTLQRTAENGSFNAEFPVTEWMGQEMKAIPSYMLRELDAVANQPEHVRASVVAGLLVKYFGYRRTSRVVHGEGTLMKFVGEVLETQDKFLTDCDVLEEVAFHLSTYARIPTLLIVGLNNNDGKSLIGRKRGHGWLVIHVDGKWQILDPTSLVEYFSPAPPADPSAKPNADLSSRKSEQTPSAEKEPVDARPDVAPDLLLPSGERAEVFVPDTRVYPKPQTRRALEEKADRRRAAGLEDGQTNRTLENRREAEKQVRTHHTRSGESFDSIAQELFENSSYHYPAAIFLALDNILHTLNHDIDRMQTGRDLIVRPVTERDIENLLNLPMMENIKPLQAIVWERSLLDRQGRTWYERRLEALKIALERELQKPSSATDEVESLLRRRAGGRWDSIRYYQPARAAAIAELERVTGVKYRRDLWISELKKAVAIGEDLLRPIPRQSRRLQPSA